MIISGSSIIAAKMRERIGIIMAFPAEEWEDLLGKMRKIADAAGHYRYALPKEFGGQDGTNLAMARIREHLAHKGTWPA